MVQVDRRRDEHGPGLRAALESAQSVVLATQATVEKRRTDVAASIAAMLRRVDLVVDPTIANTALAKGAYRFDDDYDRSWGDVFCNDTSTQPFDYSISPTLSARCGFSTGCLHTRVQFEGPFERRGAAPLRPHLPASNSVAVEAVGFLTDGI